MEEPDFKSELWPANRYYGWFIMSSKGFDLAWRSDQAKVCLTDLYIGAKSKNSVYYT